MQAVQRVNAAARKLPRWALYTVLSIPLPLYFYLALTGAMGPEPIEALEHEYGLWALWLLIAGLCITPLRKFAGLNLLSWRRAIGVMAFVYVLAHLLVWAILDVQTLGAIWADIVKRPYITIGMAGFVCLLPLAVTSNDRALRKLGAAAWRKLHLLTYPAAILAGVHFVWLRKGFQLEPILYLAAILLLLALRIRVRKRATRHQNV